ncbi:MAG: orotate phosphoribosyltransferase [Candidatus Aenigmarchaeota archaeon ex4484_56]|nr:MAG: orotate phosphoribosyltransferase [Candidatus Aenigmarchaeota archaeon ex4484_56]
MEVKSICSLCGKIDFLHTCRLCGRLVCGNCYIFGKEICISCAKKYDFKNKNKRF